MASLDPIGSVSRSASARPDPAPVARSAATEQAAAGAAQKPADQPVTVRRVELPARAFHARLNYDHASSEVIIEILDPQTGDVLQRLPPEDASNELRTALRDAGPVVKAVA